MYSYKQRKKAVELYIEYDKSASKVVRELGYATRKTLKRWYKEYYETGELHKKHRRCYSSDQKEEAIQYYLNHQRNLSLTLKIEVTCINFIVFLKQKHGELHSTYIK